MTRYRVAWQREGWDHYKTKQVRGPNDAHAFVRFLRGDIERPDDKKCCDGYQCGCRGVTRREFWQEKNAGAPPLLLVWIETRECSPWRQRGDYVLSPLAAAPETGGTDVHL